MADLDTLRPGQRAILRSLGEPGSSYADVAVRLGTTPDAVRRVAREALEDLAGRPPEVEEGWRQRLADFALGQASAPDRAAALAQLERSAAARAWTGRAIDALPPKLRRASLPVVGGAPPPRRAPRPPPSRRRVRRRELLAGGLLAVLGAGAAGWAVLRPDADEEAAGPRRRAGPLRVERQLRLTAAAVGAGAGIAVVVARAGRRELLVQARFPDAPRGRSYELRLSGGEARPRSLGAVRVDGRGNLRAARPLPADWRAHARVELAPAGQAAAGVSGSLAAAPPAAPVATG
jgi:hypothetical protein